MISVSIIIPSYNVVKYIRECILSVINQTIQNIEILCVDASSTDGTAEVINEFAMLDSRIRYIQTEKRSYGRQLNAAISLANGEYIGIVESDDYIEPEMFGTLYYEAVRRSADVIKSEFWFDYPMIDNNRIFERRRYVPKWTGDGNVVTCYKGAKAHRWDSFIWNGIYKKEFLINNLIRFNETNGAAYQDIGFQNQVLYYAPFICYIRKQWYHYRVNRMGSSSVQPSCLFYLEAEYKSLFNKICFSEPYIGDIYERMTTAFFREYRKTLSLYSSYDEWLAVYKEPLIWFKKEIVKAYHYSIQNPGSISGQVRNEMLGFIDNPRKFAIDNIQDADCLKRWLQDNYEKLNDLNGIIIFGCGKYGTYMKDFCWRNSIRISAIIDNDRSKWGKETGSITIHDPQSVISANTQNDVYIAVKNEKETIVDQLLNLCIDSNRVHVFSDQYANIPKIMKNFPEISAINSEE